jgi:hypothetical protein
MKHRHRGLMSMRTKERPAAVVRSTDITSTITET